MNFTFEIIKKVWSWVVGGVDNNDQFKEIGKIKKIDPYDERYYMLSRIPVKEFEPSYNFVFVYLPINDEKDYYIVYKNFEYQIQTLGYNINKNLIYFIDGYKVPL